MDAFDGTHYVLHRKDRYNISSGREFLTPHRLRQDSSTSRLLASCCNTPMFLTFDNSLHWISIYRSRMHEQAPPIQSRIAMRFSKYAGSPPDDAPIYRMFPLGMIAKLLLHRAHMLFGK